MSSKKRKNVLDDESIVNVEPQSKRSKEIDVPESEDVDLEESSSQTADEKSTSKKRTNARKRMKQTYKNILAQMEFYFSDANVSKSSFMTEALAKSEWLPLASFLKFNKLVSILMSSFGRLDESDLYNALKSIPSDLIEVKKSDDGAMEVHRKLPVVIRNNDEIDACTVYVEVLPQSATIETVTEAFSKFGKVLYVSLPKYKMTQIVKGFAFIEFDKPESARNAIEKSSKPQIDPDALQSVKSFLIEQEQEKELEKSNAESKTASDDEGDQKEKKKKRGKKKKNVENKNGHGNHHSTEAIDTDSLQILSKHQWKKLRNTYLDMQRKNMGKAKKKYQQRHVENYPIEEEPEQQIPEKKNLTFEPRVIVEFEVADQISDISAIKKTINAAVSEPVKYIDARIGSVKLYVRCGNADQAKALSKVTLIGNGKVLEGEEEQNYWEKANRDREDKLGGKVAKVASKKRGKDRLTQKIRKMEEVSVANSHKFFCDDDE